MRSHWATARARPIKGTMTVVIVRSETSRSMNCPAAGSCRESAKADRTPAVFRATHIGQLNHEAALGEPGGTTASFRWTKKAVPWLRNGTLPNGLEMSRLAGEG